MKVAFVVCATVLGLAAGAAAQPVYIIQPPPQQIVVAPTLSSHWILSTTVTNGNYVDQARLGQGVRVVCGQSAATVTCQSLDGKVVLTGGFEGAVVRMGGTWTDAIRMKMVGALASATLMEGHFDAVISVGLGAYQASGEWRAVRIN